MHEPKHSFTREQLVAVFSEWSLHDIKSDRNGKIDAQAQTEHFLLTVKRVFDNESPADIQTVE